METYKPETPYTIFNTYSLSLIGQGKFIAVLYDCYGDPFWVANRHNHAYNQLLEETMRYPLKKLVNMPEVDNLSVLFSDSFSHLRRFLPCVEKETANWVLELYNQKPPNITFPSKNVMEKAILGKLKVKSPLSILWLSRLSGTVYLGIFSLSELLFYFSRNNHKMVMAINSKGKLVAMSPALEARVGTNLPATDKLVEIISNAKTGNKDYSPTFIQHYKWHDMEPLENFFAVENVAPDQYRYLEPRFATDFDTEDFSLEITADISEDNTFPCLMFRTQSQANLLSGDFPDENGYNLSFNKTDSIWLLKRSGHPVARFNTSPETANTILFNLKILKTDNVFSFSLNNRHLGSYSERRMMSKGHFNSFLCFVRPLQTVKLRHIAFHFAKNTSINVPSEKPVISFNTAYSRIHFIIAAEETIHATEVIRCYEFEDLTELKRQMQALEEQKLQLQSQADTVLLPESRNPATQQLLGRLPQIARTDLTVILEGKCGVGKEVWARAIHAASFRNGGAFLKIDCAALPASMIEGELFGFAKGAFTGAINNKPGRIEEADGGTLFLDEISALPVAIQNRLLSFIQDRTVQRLGMTHSRFINTRIIVATSQSLEMMCRQRLFREDLFFRLNQVSIRIPSLNERREDIKYLAQIFLEEACSNTGKRVHSFTKDAINQLCMQDWPGNIRELRNTIMRSVLFAKGSVLDKSDLLFEDAINDTLRPLPANRKKRRYNINNAVLSQLLQQENGNIAQVALRLGATRQTVYRLMQLANINTDAFRRARNNDRRV